MHMLAENSRCSCRHSVGNMRASCLASQGRCLCMLINGRNMLRSTLRLACFPLFVNVIGINKRNTFILLPCCVCLLSQFSQEASCLFFFFFWGVRYLGRRMQSALGSVKRKKEEKKILERREVRREIWKSHGNP